jgi:nicotinamidase-related amidase
MSDFDPASTALVLIDLQHGIVGMTLAPRSGEQVVTAAKSLAQDFRKAGAPVFPVHVGWSPDFADALKQKVDQPMPRPPGGLPANWSQYVDGVVEPGDICIAKRQWGAFHGTELDMQLRRRGIRTIVLCGIATNFGVESTARQAWELGYEVVIAEDACAGPNAELHAMAITHIFPRIARVMTCADIQLMA